MASANWTWSTRALFLLIVLFWGLNYPFVVLGLDDANPLWLATFRAGVGALVVLAYVSSIRGWGRLDTAGRRDALLLGVPNTALFFGLWFLAAREIAPGLAAVIIYTFPLWVAILSVPVLQHRLKSGQWLALALGFGGVVLASQVWETRSSSASLMPIVELLAAAISWAVGTAVFQRRFPVSAIQEANAYQLIGGSVALLGATLIFTPHPLPTFTISFWLTVLWLGVLGTALAYVIWFWLLGRTEAATLAAYTFLVPVVALAASVTYFHESLSALQIAGVALVLVSIYGIASATGLMGSRTEN